MAWHRRLSFRFSVVGGLHLALIFIGARGFTLFAIPRIALALYCWQISTFYRAACNGPRIIDWLIVVGTLAMTALIVRISWRFLGQWRLYLKPTGQ